MRLKGSSVNAVVHGWNSGPIFTLSDAVLCGAHQVWQQLGIWKGTRMKKVLEIESHRSSSSFCPVTWMRRKEGMKEGSQAGNCKERRPFTGTLLLQPGVDLHFVPAPLNGLSDWDGDYQVPTWFHFPFLTGSLSKYLPGIAAPLQLGSSTPPPSISLSTLQSSVPITRFSRLRPTQPFLSGVPIYKHLLPVGHEEVTYTTTSIHVKSGKERSAKAPLLIEKWGGLRRTRELYWLVTCSGTWRKGWGRTFPHVPPSPGTNPLQRIKPWVFCLPVSIR